MVSPQQQELRFGAGCVWIKRSPRRTDTEVTVLVRSFGEHWKPMQTPKLVSIARLSRVPRLDVILPHRAR